MDSATINSDACGVYRTQNTALRHSWQDINQFTPTTVHHDERWSIRQKLCQYRQHRTSNTHRTELIQNSLMVDPINGFAEINLHDPCLLPSLQCTLQCIRQAQKCITSTLTFPISKLGGWKHTTAFHKSSGANRHQTLKRLRQHRCYGNWSVVGNRGGRWALWNRGDSGLSPASWETTQTNKPRNTTLRRGARTSAVLWRKRWTIPKWVSDPIRIKVFKETPDLTRPEGKGGKSRSRMASEWQINRLPVLLAIKMIREQISFANRLSHQSTASTNKRWQWRTQAEHSRLKSGPLSGKTDFRRISLCYFLSSFMLLRFYMKLLAVSSSALIGPYCRLYTSGEGGGRCILAPPI